MEVFIKKQNIEAVINTKGAELFSLKKDGKNYIWDVNTDFWNKTSPILFPIVGALKNGEYQYNNKTYQLPRHGFARDLEFEIISKNEDAVTFSLRYSDETLKVYPFQFELRISYILEEDKLLIKYDIINLSDEKMHYSIGAHPAFSIEGNFEEYSLIFDEEKELETYKLDKDLFSGKTEKVLLKGKELPLNYGLFAKDALVFKNSATQSLTLIKNNQPVLKVEFSEFPYLGIWTKENAPFLCIEPWLGIADNVDSTGNLTQKEGINTLDPKTEKSVSWTVELF
jgi:galactose mutarotase-like enzyme